MLRPVSTVAPSLVTEFQQASKQLLMANRSTLRSSHESDHFDILPFIAFLLIVLATLLFITMSIAALNVGAGAAEGWIPAASDKLSKNPVLIEWDGEAVIVQRPTGPERIVLGKDVPHWWNSDWDTDMTFRNLQMRAFLAEMVAKKEIDYVLFAVRPSGFPSFQALAMGFRKHGVSVGYDPIEQGKLVRLRKNHGSAP